MDSRNPRRTFEIYRGDKPKPPTAPPTPKISIKARVQTFFENLPPTTSTEPDLASPIPNETKVPGNQGAMKEAVKFITDYGEISDNVMDLMTTNTNYNVISAIGPQGSGKSTILSMLAGNDSRNMYREYMFRPVSREANELSRHQSIKTDIFKTKNQIFIDCQPTNSLSIFELTSRGDDSGARAETIKLLSFLLAVSHTVLVCSECYIDMNLIKTIRIAEQIRPYLKNFEPKISTARRTNLVFIHTKAQSIDFNPLIIRERETLLRQMFADSRWFHLNPEAGKLLIPLVEMKLRKEHTHDFYEPDNSSAEDSGRNFDDAIVKLRSMLKNYREPFRESGGAMDEKKWCEMCQEIFRDSTFLNSLRVFRRMCNDHHNSNSSFYSEDDRL